jgi:hypothetical protein
MHVQTHIVVDCIALDTPFADALMRNAAAVFGASAKLA